MRGVRKEYVVVITANRDGINGADGLLLGSLGGQCHDCGVAISGRFPFVSWAHTLHGTSKSGQVM